MGHHMVKPKKSWLKEFPRACKGAPNHAAVHVDSCVCVEAMRQVALKCNGVFWVRDVELMPIETITERGL